MTKKVLYRYLGTNGIIESPVHLEDVYYTRQILLTAEPGHVLTDGFTQAASIKVPDEEVNNWREIPA